ncbi:MAG: hypothetical protein H7Z19_18075 [Chitinophagaceae bacterium]|nr:hypothetical protein [Rubrivivax sp.]
MAIVYKCENSWDKTSELSSGSTVPNHDSNMSSEEVIRLVQAGVALLIVNKAEVGRQFEKNKKYYKEIRDLAKGLADAQVDKGGSFEIRISKGIHQFSKGVPGIGQMPHITAKFCQSGSIRGPAVHIWLSMSLSAVGGGRTTYEARSVSASEDGPFVPNCAVVQVPPQFRTRVRGNSISQAQAVVLMSERVEKEKEKEAEGWKYLNAIADLHEIRSGGTV